jgi:hypothetical protein
MFAIHILLSYQIDAPAFCGKASLDLGRQGGRVLKIVDHVAGQIGTATFLLLKSVDPIAGGLNGSTATFFIIDPKPIQKCLFLLMVLVSK